MKRGFTLIELLVVITISLFVLSTAIVGYRKFANRRVLADGLADIKGQLRLVRAKAIHGEKPTHIGLSECTQLLYYEVGLEVVAGDDDKIVWTPVCLEGAGVKEEHSVVGVDLASDGNWPIMINALEGTTNNQAVLFASYKGGAPGSVIISPSGSIE